jgi:uncharacterized protein with FMN-binding domain
LKADPWNCPTHAIHWIVVQLPRIRAVKKIALSLIALAASGAYVWVERGPLAPTDDSLSLAPAKFETGVVLPPSPPITVRGSVPADIVPPRAKDESSLLQPLPAPIAVPVRTQAFDPPAPVATTTAPGTPLPHIRLSAASLKPQVVPAAMTVAAGFADGTFTGPSADAYYGQVQVQAVVQNGQIVAIKVLQEPSDRRTSVAINRQALPMLRDEVISAQSPSVDVISGATLTSEAFIQSLTAALRGARA